MTGPAPYADSASVARAVRDERTRLADALHDGALQDLAMAQQDLAEVRGGDLGALTELGADLDRLASRLRALTCGMHEETLDELPLRSALLRALGGLHHRRRLAVSVRVESPSETPGDSFIREAARELVTNVSRHTTAAHVDVAVATAGQHVVVTVTDDGEGFDRRRAAAAMAAGHLGLARIGRAAARRGGTFTIAPTTTVGTVATLTIPIVALEAGEGDHTGDVAWPGA